MNFLIFLAVLSVLVLIHELGHFTVAKLARIRVEEFAFGLPFTKALLSVKLGETRYSIYPLMFGGFVRLYGEESQPDKDKTRSFSDKNMFVRIAVVAAGVVMNVILAIVAFGAIYNVVGIPSKVVPKVTVLEVAPDAPALLAGFKVDDRIVAVEGKPIANSSEFSELMKSWGGLGVNVTVERGELIQMFEGSAEKKVETVQLYVIPRVNPPANKGALGVVITEVGYLELRQCKFINIETGRVTTDCLKEILQRGVDATILWAGRVVEGFRTIGQNIAAGQVPKDVSGPVGIYKLTSVVASFGFWPLVELTAILSVNLAIFNILPIPALDGGRILFIAIEGIRGKKFSPHFEQKVNSWGMAVLLLLVALVTLQDVIRDGLLQKIFKR